ncbi:MAG: AAA family ATPase [Chloroflexota bacterium]
MTRVIAVANQKGGVGKTTTVVNLAAALAEIGKLVVVIDLDPQGALSIILGFDPYLVEPSTYHLLMHPAISLKKVLRRVTNNLLIAPANAELIAAEYQLLKAQDRSNRLRKALNNRPGIIDFILIDTPPNLGLLTVNGLSAARELLIPVPTEYLAMRGVRPLLDAVWKIRERINPDLQLLGVVPTMYRENSPFAEQALVEIHSVFKNKVARTPIPNDEVAVVAPAARQTVFDFDPDSAIAVAYRKLAEEVNHAQV